MVPESTAVTAGAGRRDNLLNLIEIEADHRGANVDPNRAIIAFDDDPPDLATILEPDDVVGGW